MAVIQNIRNKYGKLAGGVIAVALVGFIFMDAASGRFGNLFGHDNSVAKVNGDKIDVRDFSQRTNEYETLYTVYNGKKTVDENTRAQISQEALQNMVYENVAKQQCDKLGLTTTNDEAKDIIYGTYPDPLVQRFPYFADQKTGQFNPEYVRAFEQQAGQMDNTGKLLQEWENVKDYVVRNNVISKYTAMITASSYVPDFLIEKKIKEEGTRANMQFVKVPFTSVADNDVKVTDDDINKFIQKHKALFEVTTPMRSIEYVAFDVVPSHDDTAKIMDVIEKAKADLEKATDKTVEGIVARYSDDAQYTGVYVNKNMFMSRYADSIINSTPVGQVYGPYFENGSYRLTKVMDRKMLPDSVKCRHILVRTKSGGKDVRTDSAAKMRIDSAIAAIKAGMPFAEAVKKFSDDEGSQSTNGEYTFVLQQRPNISKEFGDFIFDEGKKGETKLVKVSNPNYSGYHYIEILSQSDVEPAVKLATINKELIPSQTTQNAAYGKANEFAGKNTTPNAFEAAIKKDGLNKLLANGIKANDFIIPGLGPSHDLIKWVYDAKVGDVSGVFSLDNKYIVAQLTSVQDKGLMKVTENVRTQLEAAVKQEKKATLLEDKYKGQSSLEAIAQATSQQVQTADSFTIGSAYIPGLGNEPVVSGYAFYPGLKLNTVSPGLKGSDGVFFINVSGRYDMPIDFNMAHMLKTRQRVMMEQQQKNMLGDQIRTTLIQNADVTYNPKNL